MRSLLLVTLGPVQEFIASARRTRDLHFGSWFLSELSRAAARKIYEINARKEDLIFPAPEDATWLEPNHPFNVANRILAIIDQTPEAVAAEVRTAVNQRLYTIRDQAYKAIALFGDQKTIAYKQIESLIEFVWVALPLPDEQDYHRVRSQLESLLAARKNTYAFQPVEWGANVPKSSLDGQLESVIPEGEYPRRNALAAEKLLALQRLFLRYGAAGLAERLSGVDLLKRSGQTAFDIRFPSTSHLAALPFLQRMERIDKLGIQTLRSDWRTYIKELGGLAIIPLKEQIADIYPNHPILDHYDGSLLFEGRLADVLTLPTTDKTPNAADQTLPDKLLQAREAQQTFYNSLDKQFQNVGLSKARPSAYYALLQADGDNMGDLIDALAEKGHEQHRKLSRALSHFAKSVHTTVVDHHQGALVYSGGDDVLAFLPLHTVLQCAIELKTQFYETLKGLAVSVACQPPTLSIGIAIVHQLESLGEARRLAHDAELQAKREDGKNALAITVSKRSGEDYRIVGQWGNIDKRLSRLVTYCREASIPVGMAYELRDLVLRLSVPKADSRYNALQDVIRVDTLRILLRKLTVPAGKVPLDKIEKIEAFLRIELGLPPKEQKGKENPPQETAMVQTLEVQEDFRGLRPVSVEMFINELVIAQMLAEAAELAQL